MLKTEFESLVKQRVTDEHYKIIENVYLKDFVDEQHGKEQLALLFKLGGIRFIKNLSSLTENKKAFDELSEQIIYRYLRVGCLDIIGFVRNIKEKYDKVFHQEYKFPK